MPRNQIDPVTYEVKAVAIDLDGTMINSAPDLAAAAILTLEQMNAPILSVETVIGMIGDGIDTLLKRCVRESLGKELSDKNIRVNCITPAVIETEILKQCTQEHIDYMLSKIPMGRVGQAEEVAAMIAWLSSDEVSFSTGADFDISGGRATY